MPAKRNRPGIYWPNQEYAMKKARTTNNAVDTTRRTASIITNRSMMATTMSCVVILSTL